MSTPLPPFGPDYDPAEALEILRLASAVSTFAPRFNEKNEHSALFPKAPASQPPIRSTLPYTGPDPVLPSLFPHRWPAGWSAGVSRGPNPTWEKSIAVSWGKSFANQALLAYNPSADAYCLAFRGTMTGGNVLEDMLAFLVPAGPIGPGDLTPPAIATGGGENVSWHLPDWLVDLLTLFKTSQFQYCPTDIPGVSERAMVHLGFRVALESLDFAATYPDVPSGLVEKVEERLGLPNTLTAMLEEVGRNASGRPIKIYVTGHSLGAGMASLAAAWLNLQPIAGATFQVKCYAFAQPKPGNDYFSYAQGVSFGNGWAYAVINSLDTVPQVGLTLQRLQALNYQGCVAFLINKLGPLAKLAQLIPPFNFVHMGQEIILEGGPALAGATPSQDGFYNLPAVPSPTANVPAAGAAPAPAPQPAATYKYPAYLFLNATPAMPDDYTPPSSTWTLSPYADEPSASLGQFAPLWQHMPWVYQQALANAIGGG